MYEICELNFYIKYCWVLFRPSVRCVQESGPLFTSWSCSRSAFKTLNAYSVGCSDIALFWYLKTGTTVCCQSDIFWWFHFQKIGELGRAQGAFAAKFSLKKNHRDIKNEKKFLENFRYLYTVHQRTIDENKLEIKIC